MRMTEPMWSVPTALDVEGQQRRLPSSRGDPPVITTIGAQIPLTDLLEHPCRHLQRRMAAIYGPWAAWSLEARASREGHTLARHTGLFG